MSMYYLLSLSYVHIDTILKAIRTLLKPWKLCILFATLAFWWYFDFLRYIIIWFLNFYTLNNILITRIKKTFKWKRPTHLYTRIIFPGLSLIIGQSILILLVTTQGCGWMQIYHVGQRKKTNSERPIKEMWLKAKFI